MKVLTEIENEINIYVNEERTEDEFITYLQQLVASNIDLPNFTDIMISQYRGNTYFAKVLKYETNTERDLSLFLDIPLATGVFRGLLSGFTVGDAFFIAEPLIPERLQDTLLRKLVFVGTDKVSFEVKGVSPSLITEGMNSFTYRETSAGEGYLYWYNQPPAQIGCMSFSKHNKRFMSGYVSLLANKSLPRANFPKLYDWVLANPDNILSVDEVNQLIIFPDTTGAYLQIREDNFALDKGSLTVPADTTTALSGFYAASDEVVPIKFNQDINGDEVTYMSPTSVPREENILLTKGGKDIARFDKSRGTNILIKAV